MNNEKLTELKEVLQKDIRFLSKFELQTTDLKLHDVSSYCYNSDQDNHEMDFEIFCNHSYEFDYKEFLDNNNIDDSNWFRCGSTIIPLDKKLLTYSNLRRAYVLELDYRDNDYTNAIDNYIGEFYYDGIHYSLSDEDTFKTVLKDVEELLKEKLFLTVEEEKKLELLEEIYNSIGGLREELKDELIDYYKVLRFIKSFKKHQVEYYKDWKEGTDAILQEM